MSIAWKWRTFDFFELWPRCISKVSWVQWFDSLHCGNFLSRRISIRFVVSLFLWLPILNKIVDRMFAYLTHFQVSAFFLYFCCCCSSSLFVCSLFRRWRCFLYFNGTEFRVSVCHMNNSKQQTQCILSHSFSLNISISIIEIGNFLRFSHLDFCVTLFFRGGSNENPDWPNNNTCWIFVSETKLSRHQDNGKRY